MTKNFRSFSFEFFPPKTTQGKKKLKAIAKKFEFFSPEYFSVTFGAGGSTKQGTIEACISIASNSVEACPHLSGIGSSKEMIKQILNKYKSNGFKKIVALRGDLPSGIGGPGDFPYAVDLIKFIKDTEENKFHLEIAAYPEIHPEADSEKRDFDNFLNKIKAGASGAITQFFFDPEPYFKFIEKCEKNRVSIPIVPGIMPIHNSEALLRMAKNCGANIPPWLVKGVARYSEEHDFLKYGIEIISNLCLKLIDFGAPSLHFYTINKEEPTISIIENLK